MNDHSFDALALHAAGRISRRTSLGALGAAGLAGLAALAGDHATAAGKKGKRKGKKKQGGANVIKKADQKCKLQEEQCIDFFKPRCPVGDQECAVDAILCCRVAGECDVIGFLLCIEEE
jgi:hypothetical protein